MEEIEMQREYPKNHEVFVFLSVLCPTNIPIDFISAYVGCKKETTKIINFLATAGFISTPRKHKDFMVVDILKEQTTTLDISPVLKKTPDVFTKFYKRYFDKIIDPVLEHDIYYSHLLEVLNQVSIPEDKILLNMLSLKMSIYSQSNQKEGLKIFVSTQKALKTVCIKDKSIFADYLVDCVFLKGYLFAHNPKKFAGAIEDAQKAIEIYKNLASRSDIGKTYVRLAWIHLYQNNTQECLKYLTLAQEYLGENHQKYISKEYCFVASWYYLEIGDFDESIELSEIGMTIDLASKNLYLGLFFRINLAVALLKKGDIEGATLRVVEGLERHEIIKRGEKTLAFAELLQTHALCLFASGNLVVAREKTEESLEVFNELMNDHPYISRDVSIQLLEEINGKIA